MQPPPLGCVATERFLVQLHFGLRVQDHASFVTGDLIYLEAAVTNAARCTQLPTFLTKFMYSIFIPAENSCQIH